MLNNMLAYSLPCNTGPAIPAQKQATKDSACPGSVPKSFASVRTYLRPGSVLLGLWAPPYTGCVNLAEEATHWWV